MGQLAKDPALNSVWDTFDFAWGEPDANGDGSTFSDPEADSGPGVPALLALEDGGVSDNESDGVPSTVPEQTQEESQLQDLEVCQDDGPPEVIDSPVAPIDLQPLLPDSGREDPTEPVLSYDHFHKSPSFEGDDVVEGGDQSPNSKQQDPPHDPPSDSEPPQPASSEMPPPPAVDAAFLARKKEVQARMAELRLGLLKLRDWNWILTTIQWYKGGVVSCNVPLRYQCFNS